MVEYQPQKKTSPIVAPDGSQVKNKNTSPKPDKIKESDFLLKAYDELKKDHKGNKKEIILTFVTACNSRLRESYRFSIAVRGDTSEGKTDLVKTVILHLPPTWFDYGTRFTRATLEDDVNKPLLIILEKPKNDEVVEALKQLKEDGMKIWKKDPDKKGKLKGTKFVEKKTVIDTSTDEESDEEEANRSLIVNIDSNVERYREVIKKIGKDASNLKKEIEKLKIKQGHSWLELQLRTLKTFDIIQIPFAPAIPINSRTARYQRDAKRFWNIVRTLAWINQYNRIQFIYEEKRVLLASPEDYYWAMYLSDEAFIQSITGVDKRLQDIIDTVKELQKEAKNVTAFVDNDPKVSTKRWINRSLVEKEIDISTNTVKKRVKTLQNKGYIETYQDKRYGPVYLNILPTRLSKHPLIGCQKAISFLTVMKNYKNIVDSYLIAVSQPIDSLFDSYTTTLPEEIDKKLYTAVKNYKDLCRKVGFEELLHTLFEDLTAYFDTPAEFSDTNIDISFEKKDKNPTDLSRYQKTIDKVEEFMNDEDWYTIERISSGIGCEKSEWLDGLLRQQIQLGAYNFLEIEDGKYKKRSDWGI